MLIKSWMSIRAIDLSARRHSFEDPVNPSLLYCDTSFILNVITHIRNTREQFKDHCSNFLRRLQDGMSDGLLLMTSDFAVDETLYKIVENDLGGLLPCPHPTRHRIMLKNLADLRKAKPESVAHSFGKIDSFCEFLEDVPIIVLAPNDITHLEDDIYLEATRLIKTYHLWPADAFHIATGLAAGADCFVAVDSDWLRVDEIDLYTCLPL